MAGVCAAKPCWRVRCPRVGTNAAQQYFEESETALQRLSGDVARDIVSAILENF